MNRWVRVAIELLLATFIILALFLGTARADAPQKPNVIVFKIDDLSKQDLELARLYVGLPTIESLIARGAVMNARVNVPICSPSRASMITGQNAPGHHVQTVTPTGANGTVLGSVTALNDTTALPCWISDYNSLHLGKYLNGYGKLLASPITSPNNPAYRAPCWTSFKPTIDPWTYRMFDWWMNDDGVMRYFGTDAASYQTTALGHIAAQWISATPSPLYVDINPMAVHTEMATETSLADPELNYSDIWKRTLRPRPGDTMVMLPFWPAYKPSFNAFRAFPSNFARPLMRQIDIGFAYTNFRLRLLAMKAVDDMIAEVIAALGDRINNTIIVIVSDNGYQHGEHGNGEKMWAYRESREIPLIIAGPGILHDTYPQLVTNVDLAVTIAEWTQATPQVVVDGTSFAGILRGENTPWRSRYLMAYWPVDPRGYLDPPAWGAVETTETDTYPNRVYIKHANGQCELYDLIADKFEINNLCSLPSRANEVLAMQGYGAQLWNCHGQSCRDGEGFPQEVR